MNLRFAVPGIPPSMNAHLHYMARAKSNMSFRSDATFVAKDAAFRAQWKVADQVKLGFTFVFTTNRRRDLDNLIASVKPLIDGLVDAGVMADDSTDHVVAIAARARVRTKDDLPGEFVVVDVETVE